MMISVVIPSRGRPAQLRACVDRFFETTRDCDVECIVILDNGDLASKHALEGSLVKIHFMNTELTTAGEKGNAGIALSQGEWIVTGADDLYWHNGWLEAALEIDNDGWVGLWDGHTALTDWATHAMISRNILNECFAGYGAFPWYRSWYSDREQKARLERAGLRAVVAHDAFVEHLHPDWHTAKMDATYELGFKWHDVDRQTYERHMAAGFPDSFLNVVSIIMPAKIRNEQDMTWLREAVASVQAQEMCDWELVIVNDNSPYIFENEWEDERIRMWNADGIGTSSARNLAAHWAQSDLLFPMDADDVVTPDALTKLLAAWNNGGSTAGFVYPSVVAFGVDFEKRYSAQPYSFEGLLKNEIMVCGLHRKSDWVRSGGWKSELDAGLEDWEYWITLGEMGVCGMPIPDYVYHYRRKSNGRLAALNMTTQKQKLVELHKDSYEGRFPVGCCGGKRAIVLDNRKTIGSDYEAPANVTLVQYIGRRAGSFGVRGNISGIRYTVPGLKQLVIQPSGAPGIDSRDVPWFLSLGRGTDFAVYAPPKP